MKGPAKNQKSAKKDKKQEKISKPVVDSDKAQKQLEAQLREDTLRLQQYEQRKYEHILFDMQYLTDRDF